MPGVPAARTCYCSTAAKRCPPSDSRIVRGAIGVDGDLAQDQKRHREENRGAKGCVRHGGVRIAVAASL